MSGFGQRSRPWPGDPTSTPSEPAAAVAAAADARGEASTLKDFGTSMDAISFGFAATAILISLFLLMAIFEHLIKPRAFPPDSPDGTPRAARHRHGRSPGKLRSPPMSLASFSGGGGAAGGGPVGADAGAAVPDVPGAAGAAAAVVPEGRCALAAARPPRFVHATLMPPWSVSGAQDHAHAACCVHRTVRIAHSAFILSVYRRGVVSQMQVMANLKRTRSVLAACLFLSARTVLSRCRNRQ
ncbi:hypothetical protein PAHAL_5G070600 [Panicum hallii]|uniref:Uncharacterized protein n=1 Tax=Panicum hallii TaxID=206008 RepID=A0A2T8IJC4_9POAL|nr:uncharacterized protein LOC112894790 isoform X1 [Panicum hallii]PVH37726.1 hypothetical protein PAHAL_5G070600 [Panicum hallii]